MQVGGLLVKCSMCTPVTMQCYGCGSLTGLAVMCTTSCASLGLCLAAGAEAGKQLHVGMGQEGWWRSGDSSVPQDMASSRV